jgi:hypothetical protein
MLLSLFPIKRGGGLLAEGVKKIMFIFLTSQTLDFETRPQNKKSTFSREISGKNFFLNIR